jgi:hypothetical protein
MAKPPPSPNLEDWSAFFPEIEGCKKAPEPLVVGQVEPAVLTIKYSPATQKSNEIRTYELFPWPDCGTAQILITGPPERKPITKKELRDQRILEKIAKASQKGRDRGPRFYLPPPPPRSFTINGYEAIEYFPGPCDTVGCQMYQTTSITVRFATNRQVSLTLDRSRRAAKILEAIDFEKLNASLTSWLERRKLSQRK